MDTNSLSYFIDCSRIKSARRKKRLQKEDKEKQLIQINKKEKKLREQRWNLPLLPLDVPYQKGWKRFFILRDDVARSKDANFFTELLSKINTEQFANNKSFTKHKKKKRKKIEIDIQQQLKSFSESEWIDNKYCKLNDKERELFKLVKRWCNNRKKFYNEFLFTESWRYVLKIKPHFITHYKMHDNVLEQQINELENKITNHNLRHKISRLTYGKRQNWKRYLDNFFQAKYRFRNKALHTILYECNQEEF